MIEKYLNAFPYMQTTIVDKENILIFLKSQGESKALHMLDIENSLSYDDSKVISSEDFSKRAYWPIVFDSKKKLLYIISDDENQENYNIYTLNLSTSKLEQITKTTYCGVYGLSPDKKILVYGDRYKTGEGKFYTRVYKRCLETNREKLLCDDADWKYRFSWSDVVFDQGGKNVFISVDLNNERKTNNIVRINLESTAVEHLLQEEDQSSELWVLNKRIEGNNLYYCSNKNGYLNAYKLKLDSLKTSQLTHLSRSLNGINILEDNTALYITVNYDEKNETHLFKVDLTSDSKLAMKSEILRGSHSIAPSDSLWLSHSSMSSPNTFTEYKFNEALCPERSIKPYQGNLNKLVHNSYRYVEYETFDGHKVSAFLSLPKTKIRGAIITAFYGGYNYYSWQTQLFSELGIIELSPAVRGSETRGKEWRDLIKGDLGGNEIIDLHFAAKFLEKEFKLESSQIGLEGGSHGGYSVLRGMTMGRGFNGINESYYPYGFGICWAGFADLEDFYKTSNIPDWLVDMLGPYEGNEEKYRERSPVHNFENLNAPVFISHGTNDARVSPTSMDGFIEKLRASDKDYSLHMMAGLGHGGGNQNEEIVMYNKMISFLKKVLNI